MYGNDTKSPTTGAQFQGPENLECTSIGADGVTVVMESSDESTWSPHNVDPTKQITTSDLFYSIRLGRIAPPPSATEQKLSVIVSTETRTFRFVANPKVTR